MFAWHIFVDGTDFMMMLSLSKVSKVWCSVAQPVAVRLLQDPMQSTREQPAENTADNSLAHLCEAELSNFMFRDQLLTSVWTEINY